MDSLIGSDGSRLATASGSAIGWLLPDLHGDIAGASSSTLGTITDAIRYDAFGTIAASTTSALPTPWRYQGQLLVSPPGASDLYGAGARFYAPGLGVFTQLDTTQGGALNPLSMNRFLYAAADPETLIDPSGHRFCTVQNADNCDVYRHGTDAKKQKAIAKSYAEKEAAKKAARDAYLKKERALCAKYGECSYKPGSKSTPVPQKDPAVRADERGSVQDAYTGRPRGVPNASGDCANFSVSVGVMLAVDVCDVTDGTGAKATLVTPQVGGGVTFGASMTTGAFSSSGKIRDLAAWGGGTGALVGEFGVAGAEVSWDKGTKYQTVTSTQLPTTGIGYGLPINFYAYGEYTFIFWK